MILASGCFDGLHAGHVRYLQAARRLSTGETLAVAIAPDTYIRTAKQRDPYWTQRERAHTVFALGCVDTVIVQAEESIAGVIRDYHPRVFVKGPDWKGQLPADVLDACQEAGTQIVYTGTQGRHTREARG